jgi:hypothetical protein
VNGAGTTAWPAEARIPELPTPPSMPVTCAAAYLDQQQWVRLARGADADSADERDRLTCATTADRLVTPLSAGHYSETWHRGDWTSRWRLARLMWDNSRLLTLAPLHALVRQELATAMRGLGLTIEGCSPVEPIGTGVNHAFASPTGRLTLHETVSDDGNHGRLLTLDEVSEEAKRFYVPGERGYEWFSLAGMPEDMHMDGLDLKTHRRAGQDFADFEQDLASRARQRPEADRRIYVIAADSDRFWRSFEDLLTENDYQPSEVFHELRASGRTAVLDLVMSLPCFGLFQELRARRHANTSHRWEPNDRIDLLTLAVAAVHCDVVVTERHWTHELTQVSRHRPVRATATARLSHALDRLGA